MIKFKSLSIPEVILIEPQVFNDARGFFFESYNQNEFENAIGQKVKFVQDNHSKSSKGVLRGLHYQNPPFDQAKLVRVIKGEIWDVAVDIRSDSNTYGYWVGEILSEENKNQLWIPKGFAHGFLVLSESAEIIYKTDNFYSKNHERCLLWNDKTLNIKWPSYENIILSSKDKDGLLFDDI